MCQQMGSNNSFKNKVTFNLLAHKSYIYMYMSVCVCMCACVYVRV